MGSSTTDTEEGYDQGTWVLVTPGPPKRSGRNDGKSGRDIVDTAALRRLTRLLTKNVDERIAASLNPAEDARDGEEVG
jgi:hypothetical protein